MRMLVWTKFQLYLQDCFETRQGGIRLRAASRTMHLVEEFAVSLETLQGILINARYL